MSDDKSRKEGLTHAEVSEIAIRWFKEQPQYQGWHIIPNRSGVSEREGRFIPYGVPPVGGGSDFMLFGNRDGNFTCEFLEVKTIADPKPRANQRRWLSKMAGLGARCWIFRETVSDPGFEVVRFRL